MQRAGRIRFFGERSPDGENTAENTEAAERPRRDAEDEVGTTVAVQVRMPGGTGRIMGDTSERQAVTPLEGGPRCIAEELLAYARAGIGHVQLVVDPITQASVAALAPALEELDRG